MLEALILWKLFSIDDRLAEEDEIPYGLLLAAVLISAALWPVGLYIAAREYAPQVKTARRIVATAVITVLALKFTAVYVSVAILWILVASVWIVIKLQEETE